MRRTVSSLFLCAAFWRTYKVASFDRLLTRVLPSFDPYGALSAYVSISNDDGIACAADRTGPIQHWAIIGPDRFV